MQRANGYLIAKGWAGFGDRLHCLSYTLDQALCYKRILWVDWSDRHWSHGGFGFQHYFDLIDVPYVNSLDQIPPALTVFPQFWQHKLSLPVDRWAFGFREALLFDPKQALPPQALWVHPGIGKRPSFLHQLFQHLRISAQVVDELKALMALAPRDLPLVHLRGTDRGVSDEELARLQKSVPVACVVSDDAALVQRWCAASPESVVLTDVLTSGPVGTHSLDASALEQMGVDKHDTNLRLLADF